MGKPFEYFAPSALLMMSKLQSEVKTVCPEAYILISKTIETCKWAMTTVVLTDLIVNYLS